MKDIFQANMLCDKCNIKTDKKIAIKDGFKIRFFECPNCNEKWYHPTDMKEYQEKLLNLKKNLHKWKKK